MPRGRRRKNADASDFAGASKTRSTGCFALLALVLLAGCGLESMTGRAMGTSYSVQGRCWSFPRAELAAVIERIDELMTTYDPASDLMRLNRGAVGAWIEVDPAVVEVLDIAREISDFTAGAFDVTAGLVSARLGFGAKEHDLGAYVRGSYRDIETRIDDNRAFARRTRHVMVDLSAIAKGYAVDRAVFVLETACSSGLVELGGEVRAFGTGGERSWRVAIESIDSTTMTGSVYSLTDGALATSGHYRQRRSVSGGSDVTHIVGRDDRGDIGEFAQITVVARSAAVADALATALYAMRNDAEAFARSSGLPARFVAEGNGEAHETPGFRSIIAHCEAEEPPPLWCRN